MVELNEKAKEHDRIWLEPAGAPDRCWCEDNQWGDDGVEYVRVSALPAPDDGLEVVGYAYRGPRGGLLVTEEPWKHAPEAVPLVNLSDAQAALQSKDEQVERLTRERDEALEAEDEAKDCFWAIYPDWVEMKGHGINAEAARTMLADQITALRAENERLRIERITAERDAADYMKRLNKAAGKLSIAENVIAELVKALGEISGEIDGTWDVKFNRAQEIARAALKGQSNE